MKYRLFVFSLMFFINISLAQDFGISAGIVDMNNYKPYGYGLSLEYYHNLSDNFDFTIIASFIYNKTNGFEYKHLPLLSGFRFYVKKGILQPYISLEALVSYFNNDELHEIFIDPSFPPGGTTIVRADYDGIYAGISTSAGSLIIINDYLKINLNARLGLVMDRNADFFSLMQELFITYKI